MSELPDTLLARLRVIAGRAEFGGIATQGYVSRGDQRLVDMGLLEQRGQRLLPTDEGLEVLEADDE